MGKKKGRQCGDFSSKSKRAAHLTEIYKNADLDTAVARCQRSKNLSRHRSSSSASKGAQNERASVDFRHLQTLLQERRHEDQMRATVVSRRVQHQHAVTSHNAPDCLDRDSINEVGWILSYNHKESRDPKEEKLVPSLQDLSARALAPILQDYVSAYGEYFVHESIGLLPSTVISEISANCENITDNLAHVLGNHPHLKGLVLNGSLLPKCEPIGDKINGKIPSRLTDKGLHSLIPQLICSKTPEKSTENDSWENLESCHDNEIFSGCWKLQRLELRNHDTKSIENLVLLLERCSHITHLCLSNSLNGITGPAILLHSGRFSFHAKNLLNWEGRSENCTLIDLLKNLQVLDLSQCRWLNYELLLSFLKCLKERSTKLPLEIICIAGCCPVLLEKVQMLNVYTCQKPLISATCQKRFDL